MAKTQAQRSKEHKAKRKQRGLSRISDIWAYKQDHRAVKIFANELTAQTEKAKAEK